MKGKKSDLVLSFILLFLLMGCICIKIHTKIYDKNNTMVNLIDAAITEVDSHAEYQDVDDFYNDASYRFILNDLYENSKSLTTLKRSDYNYAVLTVQKDLSILCFDEKTGELTDEDKINFTNAYGELNQMLNGHKASIVFSVIFFVLASIGIVVRVAILVINMNKPKEENKTIQVEADEISE